MFLWCVKGLEVSLSWEESERWKFICKESLQLFWLWVMGQASCTDIETVFYVSARQRENGFSLFARSEKIWKCVERNEIEKIYSASVGGSFMPVE
jgi:hypothetical protein